MIKAFLASLGGVRKCSFRGVRTSIPVEVENALYTHTGVAECAVLGVPDAQWGEVGLAAVVLKPTEEVNEAALGAFLREKLAGYKVPKYIRVVDALPKSGAGKILKTALAQLASLETSQ